MKTRLTSCGPEDQSVLFVKLGPKQKTPASLAARMPSAEVAAKVGITNEIELKGRRVQRRRVLN